MSTKTMTTRCCPLIIALTLVVCANCRRSSVTEFEPNMVFAHAMELQTGCSMKQGLQETQAALHRFFGTMDDPKLPDFASEEPFTGLIDLERLRAATGAHPKVGVYRKHCATCHGLVGNGRGTTAALLDPYPRDFRAGKFKFKSTPRGRKPLRADLEYVIQHGIVGTAMKTIPELKGADIQALIDSIIYLSWRGEVERDLLRETEYIAFESEESLFDTDLEHTDPEKFAAQVELVERIARRVASSWLSAPEHVNQIPSPPSDLPVPDTIVELLRQLESGVDSQLHRSVARGKEVFGSDAAACAKCHGNAGHGDGITQDYDDWTKEWTVRIGIDPADEISQIPLVARGALPPRKLIPRDFRLGLFHGGNSPEQLYRRISEGIDATPMPANSVPPQDIWHLVNYVRSIVSLTELSSVTTVGTR